MNTARWHATALVVAALAALAAAPVAPACAQFGSSGSEHHLLRIGFGGGMSVPTQHAADALKTGVNGEGFLLVDLGILPPLRFNLGYQKFDYKQLSTGQSQGTTNILSGVGGLSITIIPFGPLRPYVTAGVGAFHISDDVATTLASGTGTPTVGATASAVASSVKFGIDGGAGLRLKLGRLEAFAEGRVQNVYTDQGFIDRKKITSIPVSFGILF